MKNEQLLEYQKVGGIDGHSINCTCDKCTGGDYYLKRLKAHVGRTAAFSGLPAHVGDYNTRYFRNNAETSALVQPVSVSKPNATVAPTSGGSEWLNLFKDLGLEALGTLMDKQKSGTLTDPTLNQIGQLGNQIAQAGVNAGVAKANTTVGENVIKFSPWIIGGVVLLLGIVIYLVAKKS